MKRFILCLALLMLALPARAAFPDRVRDDLPRLTITVTEDVFDEAADRPFTLTAHIAAEDGSLTQAITWQSNESPGIERAAAMTLLADNNFDGYADLQLLTAQGARNVFYTFALWNPETGRFDPVMPDGASGQLEVCNPVFFPDRQEMLSSVADGYRYRTETLWRWEAGRWPERSAVFAVYEAGPEQIGESLTVYGTGTSVLWDQAYPESWYYGDDAGGAYSARSEAVEHLTLGSGLTDSRWMQVANVTWVNLRHLDSRDSDSLARLVRGTDVQVLREGCGADGGWVMVWIDNGTLADPRSAADTADGLTGYIWHSYLEPTFLQVANTDWVHLREQPDKQSASIAKLNAGTRVTRCGRGMQAVDGWVPVSVAQADGRSLTGYIWHSFLEENE